jgi:hypothetical protein
MSVDPIATSLHFYEQEVPPAPKAPPDSLKKLGPWQRFWNYWLGRNGVRFVPVLSWPNPKTLIILRHSLCRAYRDYSGNLFTIQADVFCNEADLRNAEKLLDYAWRYWPVDDTIEGNGDWVYVTGSRRPDGYSKRIGNRYVETIKLVGAPEDSDVLYARELTRSRDGKRTAQSA